MSLRTNNVCKHNLRNQNAYYIQQIKMYIRKFTTNYSEPKSWKALPHDFPQTVSINKFKMKLKELLWSKYD